MVTAIAMVAAGLSPDSAPHSRAEQWISMVSTASDKMEYGNS